MKNLKLCLSLLCLSLVFWFTETKLIFAQEASETRISVPFYAQVSSQIHGNALFTGAGLRINNHEFNLLFSPNRQRNRYFGGSYRYYLPGGGKPVSPFVGAEFIAGKSRSIRVAADPERFTLESRTATAFLGADIRIWKGLQFTMMTGASWAWGHTHYDTRQAFSGVEFPFYLGFKYDLLLKGKRSDRNTLPEEHADQNRFFLTYRAQVQEPIYLGSNTVAPRSTSHLLEFEYAILPALRITASARFGAIPQLTGNSPDHAFQGLGIGLRARLYEWNRLAFFYETGVQHLNRPKYDLQETHAYVGGSMEYKIAPNLYLSGGIRSQLNAEKFRYSANMGLTVGLPFGQKK